MGVSYGGYWNYAWFLSDNNFEREVGYIELYESTQTGPTRVRKNNEWASIASSDSFRSIGFLLVREAQDVPEPSALAIFALGMMGLASRRFKKKS